MATDLPIIMTAAGAQPTPPATLLAQFLALATAQSPGLTANLPASLIEDVSSTAVGALTVIDQARVDLINSIDPYAANIFLLIQLGNIYGVAQGQDTNTSVYVNFTGTPGFVVIRGFIVSDGSNQYVVQDGAAIATDGQANDVYCLAVNAGSFPVPAGSVTELITSVPSTVDLAVTNPQAGVPGASAQSEGDFRAQVIQAGLAVSQGTPAFVKTLLENVPGVQARLVAFRQVGGNWEIICGGGDPYQVAGAIFLGMADMSVLIGSTLEVVSITKANPGVVETNLNHGYATGQVIEMTGVVGMTEVNGVPYTITVIDETHFSLGVDTTSYTTYVSGGVVTPNLRNVSVSVNNFPDTYEVVFVEPPQQAVGITLLWNTTSDNYVNPASVAALGSAALVGYINSLQVGLPINLYELQTTFQTAIASLVPPQLLSRMSFTVTINSVDTSPESGTGLIVGDPESYFETTLASIVIDQG